MNRRRSPAEVNSRSRKKGVWSHLTIYLREQHFVDAVAAEADARNMSVSAFMRAMIRGYFAAALHGK